MFRTFAIRGQRCHKKTWGDEALHLHRMEKATSPFWRHSVERFLDIVTIPTRYIRSIVAWSL
jgi:hypothetical protein